MREDAKKRAGLALATALSLACVAALLGVASWGRGGARPVAMAYKQMSMQEAIAAAKHIQQRREVTSAYQPKPKIQAKHKQHRAAAAAAAATAAAAPGTAAVAAAPGKHVTDMTADEVADGTDVVFHDFDAKAYSSDDARETAKMVRVESKTAMPKAAASKAPAARSHVPVPADYARGLIVQPAHTDVNGFPTAAAVADHAKESAARAGAAASRSTAGRSRRASPSTPSSISSAAAQSQIYNNDDGVKVVTGTEGDNVASGVGGGVGGQEWVRARKARIAAAHGEEPPRAEGGAAHAAPPRAQGAHTAPRSSQARRAVPQKAPKVFDTNYDNDANVKVVDGTEGDNVASGMGGGIDGASWVAARKARIAGEGGVQSPIGPAGANSYKGEVAYPADQGEPVKGARRVTSEDIERTVGTNIVFHNIKNEGGIARGQTRRVGIRYNDREMY